MERLFALGDIHKPRGQFLKGVSQMTILLHKPYLLKVTTKGGGVKNTQNFDHVAWLMDDPLKYVTH